jgi:hypothetical protein
MGGTLEDATDRLSRNFGNYQSTQRYTKGMDPGRNFESTLRNIPEERRSQVTGCCEYGHEPSGSMKWGELLDQLRNSFIFSTRTLLPGFN